MKKRNNFYYYCLYLFKCVKPINAILIRIGRFHKNSLKDISAK